MTTLFRFWDILFPFVLQKYAETLLDLGLAAKDYYQPADFTALDYDLNSIMHYGYSYKYIAIGYKVFVDIQN